FGGWRLGGGGCVASPAPLPPSSPTAAAVAEGGGCVGVYGVVLGGVESRHSRPSTLGPRPAALGPSFPAPWPVALGPSHLAPPPPQGPSALRSWPRSQSHLGPPSAPRPCRSWPRGLSHPGPRRP
ncbi:unnamed protein product, partial [Closterium sp. NIES-54]